MTIVIAGGSGFLGRKLAKRLESEGHQVITLTRRANGAGGQVAVATRWRAGRTAPASRRRRRGRESRRRGHRRQAMERGAESTRCRAAAFSRRERWSAPWRCARRPPRVFVSGIGGRLLRPSWRLSRSPKRPHRVRTSWRGYASNGNRRRAWSNRRRRGWRSCAPASRSTETAARWRRCCCPSSSGSAPRSDQAINSCRGFTSTTGPPWCRG